VDAGFETFRKLGFFELELIGLHIFDMLNKMALVGMKTDRAVSEMMAT
jgi:hypothetical protein